MSTTTAPSFSRSLVTVGRNDGAHRAALRVGVSVLIPLLVLWACGHVEWSVYAAFGAFASVYGRNVTAAGRLRMQGVAAVVMVVSVVLGTVIALAPAHEWMTVGIACAWAMLVALISQAARFTPPGPLFAVFALCAVASIPAASVVGEAAPGAGVLVAVVVSGASAALALLIGQVGTLRGRGGAVQRAIGASRAAAPGALAAPPTPVPVATESASAERGSAERGSVERASVEPARTTAQSEAAPAGVRARLRSLFTSRASLLSAARFGVAIALAGSLSTALHIGHPYWAMVAAVVPLVAFDLAQTMLRGAHRVLGTIVGLAVAWGLLALQPSGVWAILLVVALQIAAELLILRNYGLALVFITPLALVMVSLAHPAEPTGLIADRGVETLLGTLVAVAVALLWSGMRMWPGTRARMLRRRSNSA